VKKLLVLGVVVGALVGAGLIAYAAYVVDGTSSPENFAAGAAANLVPDPNEGQLAGILPGQTKNVDVSVTNNNSVPVTVTDVDLTVTPAGCAVTTTASIGSWPLGAGATGWWVIPATMGNADPWCEGQTLQVSATATGTMP
jgi:hypothetical protein